jgi:hypothetical protein
MGRYATNLSGRLAFLFRLLLAPVVSACASVPLEPAGSLSSYQSLTPSNGILTRAQVSVAKNEILATKTVRIVPTTLSAAAREAKLSEEQRRLIANAIDRSLSAGLERIACRFGGPPKESVCEAFGGSPGLLDLAEHPIGLPPEWTDNGAQPDAPIYAAAAR